ncbi:MAG: hypothetical protein AAF335_02560 [Bacteroidota bacterium]
MTKKKIETIGTMYALPSLHYEIFYFFMMTRKRWIPPTFCLLICLPLQSMQKLPLNNPAPTQHVYADDEAKVEPLQPSESNLSSSIPNNRLFSSNHCTNLSICPPLQDAEQCILHCLALAKKEYSLHKGKHNPLAFFLIDFINTANFEKNNESADLIIEALKSIFPQYYQKTLNAYPHNTTFQATLQPSLAFSSTQPAQKTIPSTQVTFQRQKKKTAITFAKKRQAYASRPTFISQKKELRLSRM